MTTDRNSKAFRTALGAMALGLGLVGATAAAEAHEWKRGRGWGPPAVVVVPAAPVRYAAPVVYAPAPVVYAPAPVMVAPAYPAYAYPAYAGPGSLSIGLNVPLR